MIHRIKLHTKFIVLLISVSLVPLVIVSAVTLLRFQATLEEDAAKLGQQLTATASAEIKTFMVSQFGVLENIAAIYHPDFPIQPDTAAGIVNTLLLRSENFSDIAVVNADGKEIVRKNRLLSITKDDLRDRSASEAFAVVKERGIYVGPVYLAGGRPYFDLGRRIVDAKGNFAGAVFAQVNASIMTTVVTDISHLVEAPGRVFLVNEKGTAIAHTDLSYVLAGKNLSILPTVKSIVDAPNTPVVPQSYTNENGDKVFGSVTPMTIELFDTRGLGQGPSLNWFVIAEQPEAAVYGSARQAALFSLLISLLAILIAVFAAIFFAGKVSHPIESLHHAAEEFGKGNLSYRAPIETKDEIGDLAQSFNTTAGALEETVQSLQKEEQIVEAERDKLSLILTGITNAVIAVDRQQKVILFNKAAEVLTGFTMKDAIGKPISEIFQLFDGDAKITVEQYCPPSGSVEEGPVFNKNNVRMVGVHGEEHFVNFISGRTHGAESINLGCVLTFQDITREFVMERTKREFVSIAAHQLRTPLTGMSWTIEALLSGDQGALNAGQKELAEGGLDAIHRMLALVNDLLDVSRIEEGRFGITFVRQPLTEMLARTFTVFERVATKKGVAFHTAVPENLPPLDFDADKIELVLNNIIDNAIKYTPAGGTVRVVAEEAGKEVVLSIADTGIGIPKAESERVFTKFFRSRRALAQFTDGSGLGLYVAKNIIAQHGGRIWFDSEEDKGTTFFIALPIPLPGSPLPANIAEPSSLPPTPAV